MTYQQYRVVWRLVHSCCNYQDGNCLRLDDGEKYVCPQAISYSLICRWFRAAVLPLDGELCATLFPPPAVGRRRCRECKQIFTLPKHNTLYCLECAVERAKRSKRDWARKKRAGAWKKCPLKTR